MRLPLSWIFDIDGGFFKPLVDLRAAAMRYGYSIREITLERPEPWRWTSPLEFVKVLGIDIKWIDPPARSDNWVDYADF